MNYGCMSCGAKYSIPDARLDKAGAEGLRVRCSRCRAIMAVSASTARESPKSHDDVFSRTGGVSTQVPSTALVTGVIKNPFADFATPDQKSTSQGTGHQGQGAGNASQGISREVTGIFMPMIASLGSLGSLSALGDDVAAANVANTFYAAIDGRARGPYTSTEMLMLAQKGKIRASTLLWKPRCSGWKPLRHVVDFDVAFLLDAVRTRKRREREAEALAQLRLGIVPVRIERQTVRPVGSFSPAPPLPVDAAFDFDDAPALPQIGPGNEVSSPFLWRAPGARPVATSMFQALSAVLRRWWTAAAILALLVAVGLMTAGVVLPF